MLCVMLWLLIYDVHTTIRPKNEFNQIQVYFFCYFFLFKLNFCSAILNFPDDLLYEHKLAIFIKKSDLKQFKHFYVRIFWFVWATASASFMIIKSWLQLTLATFNTNN